jgi:spore germination cell wall hydrolase CwlJ-like protein
MGMSRFHQLTDAQLLAVCLYGEARGESDCGKIAVASTIKERVKQGGWYGLGYKGVILKPYQFSCFNCSDPNFTKLFEIAGDFSRSVDKSATLRRCYEIARGIIEGSIQQTLRSTHYKTHGCKASWADKMKKIATVDSHSFYMEG